VTLSSDQERVRLVMREMLAVDPGSEAFTDPSDIRKGGGWRWQQRIDLKIVGAVAAAVILVATLVWAGPLRPGSNKQRVTVLHPTVPSVTSHPSTSLPVVTTVPTTTVPPRTNLTISVQSDSQMKAVGNDGPSSSILLPSSCQLSGNTVTAIGTYQGGSAPNVYNRYGDIVELYIFGAPSSGYPEGTQLGASPVNSSPVIGSGTWQVSTTVDLSTGQPVSCVVAAQPTHQVQLAP
jgi:hypothetical protein